MPEKAARLVGCRTNNLKGFDAELKHGVLNLIVGPSGSGKSSLAYDTVAQIGLHEYMSMCGDDFADCTYSVEGYSGMLATVPLKQACANTNTHSTIGTYFGLNRALIQTFSAALGVREDYFVLNKASNLCPKCHGVGVVRALDKNKIVDYNTPLKKGPFKCWNRYKDFFAQMIVAFCADSKIDPEKTFRELSEKERQLLLFGESKRKYSVRYKKVNRLASRTSGYFGVMTGKPMLPNVLPGDAFYSDVLCPECGGKRYSRDHESAKLCGYSFGDVMMMPFGELSAYLTKVLKQSGGKIFTESLKQAVAFIEKSCELNLGHLNLNRGIPTLSGGELQRLRLAKIFNTQLSNLMVILDEPLAGVSKEEKKSIYRNITALTPRQTVVVVDHGESFRSVAKNVIALGEGGGAKGGLLVDPKGYFARQRFSVPARRFEGVKSERIRVYNDVYGYEGAEIDVPMGGLTLLVGRSGVGKSILLRDFLPLHFESYSYISQRLLMAGKQSSVATILDLASPLEALFAKKFSKPRQFFSKQTGCDGACPVCNGYGYQDFSGNGGREVLCQECGGSGFNHRLDKLMIGEKNIADIWDLTLDEAKDYFDSIRFSGADLLQRAQELLLGHLKFGQMTKTLSGGENIRIKLLKAFKSRDAVLGVDEPFRGLDKTEISKVIAILYGLVDSGKTILVVDHTEGVEDYFSNCFEVVNDGGMLHTRSCR